MTTPLDQLKQKTIAELSKYRIELIPGIRYTVAQQLAFDEHMRKLNEIEILLTQAIEEAWEAGGNEGAECARVLYTKEYEQGFQAGIQRAKQLIDALPNTALRGEVYKHINAHTFMCQLQLETDLFPSQHAYCIERGFTICEHTAKPATIIN